VYKGTEKRLINGTFTKTDLNGFETKSIKIAQGKKVIFRVVGTVPGGVITKTFTNSISYLLHEFRDLPVPKERDLIGSWGVNDDLLIKYLIDIRVTDN